MSYKNNLPFYTNRDKDYIHSINDMLKKVFKDYREYHKESDASLKDTLLFLVGVLGCLSTEMLTSIFTHANLASIRTVLHELNSDNLIYQIRLGDLKKHEDSLICTIYCLAPRGKAKLKDMYPDTQLIEVTGPSRSTLHSYYTSICLLAGYMSGLSSKWEYEDYLSSTMRNGIRVRERLLRADAALLSDKMFCMIETDTGTETIPKLIEKLLEYYRHDTRLITNDLHRNRYAICFTIMKPRVSLADEPRYSPSKLRVVRQLIQTPYVTNRLTYFAELADIRYDRTGLSHRKSMICREVMKDMISNSPLDLNSYSLDRFEAYYSRVVAQTSSIYQEDRARVHDHLCASRLNNLTDILLKDIAVRKIDNAVIKYLLNGQECYFVPVLRLHSLLPFVFDTELVVEKLTTTLLPRYDYLLKQNMTYFKKPEFHHKYWIGRESLAECAPEDHVCLANAFKTKDDDDTFIYCIENIEYDLGARIRVAFAERYLTPGSNFYVSIICIVRNQESYDRLKPVLGLNSNKSSNVATMSLSLETIVPDK